MATDSAMTHYCDWAISILIQQAGYARQAPLWEALSWLHAGYTLALHFLLLPTVPRPLLSLPLDAFIFTYCSRLKAIIAAVQRGQRMPRFLIQQRLKIFPLMLSWCNRLASSEPLKRVHSGFEMRWPAYIARNSVRGNFELLVYKKKEILNMCYTRRRPRFDYVPSAVCHKFTVLCTEWWLSFDLS